MSYNQGDPIKVPNNSMKLFTALLIHDVKHDFGPQRLWSEANIIPVCKISTVWKGGGRGLRIGGGIGEVEMDKITSFIDRDDESKKFKEYFDTNYIVSCGLYHADIYDKLNVATFSTIADSINISIQSVSELDIDTIKFPNIDFKNSKLVISQKLLINFISYIIRSRYNETVAVPNSLILKAIYYTIVIYYSKLDDNKIREIVASMTGSPHSDIHNIIKFALNILYDKVQYKSYIEEFESHFNILFDIIITKNIQERDNRIKKVSEKHKELRKYERESELKSDDKRSRSLKRSDSGNVSDMEMEGGAPTGSCSSASKCLIDDTCNYEVDDVDVDPDEDANIDGYDSDNEVNVTRVPIREHNRPSWLHLDPGFQGIQTDLNRYRPVVKKVVTVILNNTPTADLVTLFQEKGGQVGSDPRKRFLLITNTILASLVNTLYKHVDKLTLVNPIQKDKGIDDFAKTIFTDYCNKGLYQHINLKILTKSTATLDQKLFQKVVIPNVDSLHTLVHTTKIIEQEIFPEQNNKAYTNNKAYIINNAAIPFGSDDRSSANGPDRIFCPLSSIIDPAPPYLGGCGYAVSSDYNEFGNSDIKIESEFNNNGKIYYNAFQTKIGDQVKTGYKLFIGNNSKFGKSKTTSEIGNDYIYLTNVNEQNLTGDLRGLSVVQTYDRFVEELINNFTSIKIKDILTNDNHTPADNNKKFTFLSIILLKSLGDMIQEFNGILKYGGYIKNPTNKINNPNIMPWNNGDALRCVLSNDQPSAARIILYKYIFPKECLNQLGYGGYCHYNQSGNKNKTYVIIPYSAAGQSSSVLGKQKAGPSSAPGTSSYQPSKKQNTGKQKVGQGITRKIIKKKKSIPKISRKKKKIKKKVDILTRKKLRIKSQKNKENREKKSQKNDIGQKNEKKKSKLTRKTKT